MCNMYLLLHKYALYLPLQILQAHIRESTHVTDGATNEAASPLEGPDETDPKCPHVPSPFIIQSPNSQQADKYGLQEGEMISKYAEDATVLQRLQAQLQREVDAHTPQGAPKIEIGITRFRNWAKTQESLLLLAKPIEKEQVVSLVKAAAKLEVKVSYSIPNKA